MSSQNWKSKMYRIYGILFLVPIVLGCFANSSRTGPGNRRLLGIHYSEGGDSIMFDSLEIERYSIFADSLEVHLYESYRINRASLPDVPGNPISGNLVEVAHGEELYLTVLLKNLSSTDLRIPKRMIAKPCEFLISDQLEIGIFDLAGDTAIQYPLMTYSNVLRQEHGTGYYRIIRSHEVMLAIDSLAIFRCFKVGALPAGDYEVRCWLGSQWWEPGEPPVWIGSTGEYSFPLRIVPLE